MTHKISNGKKHLAMLMLVALSFTSLTFAQDMNSNSGSKSETEGEQCSVEQSHAINFCPAALAFGIYSVNYEYLHNQRHGFDFRAEYEAIPDEYTDAKIDAHSWAVLLNYRYHLQPGMNSYFVGSFVRYRKYDGKGTVNGNEYNFNVPDFTVGLNAGKRWVFDCGVNVTFMLGYGYSTTKENIDANNVNFQKYVDEFQDDYNFAGGFLGEFSIGYAF